MSASLLRRLARDTDGGNAIEMAVVMMVIILLTVGTTDLALAMWQWSVSEKATQQGARTAAVSDFAADALAGWSGPAGYPPGTPCWQSGSDICTFAESSVVSCTSAGCSAGGGNLDQAAFDAIVTAMRAINPMIQPANVAVDYTFNGLGFVGRPGGLPLDVTVRLTGMNFSFVALDTLIGRPGQIPMPPFTATLVGEDYNSSM